MVWKDFPSSPTHVCKQHRTALMTYSTQRVETEATYFSLNTIAVQKKTRATSYVGSGYCENAYAVIN
jgi:hypothetical protein